MHRYKGKTYARCTQVDETQPWCATRVNSKGVYKASKRGRGGGAYAYCVNDTAC